MGRISATRLRGALAVAVMFCAAPVAADPARILDLQQIEPLFEILRDEGVAYGEDLSQEMLGRAADPGWIHELRAIHAPERMIPAYRAEFTEALGGADQARIEAWLASDLGQRVITLEIAARRALLDPEAEAAALATAAEAADRGDPRIAAVRGLIAAGDLVENNVTGGLNANLAFYRALAAGGGVPYDVSEPEMIAAVAAQEGEIRADVAAWVEAYLFLALSPLTPEEITRVAEFTASPAGRALLSAENRGFDRVFEHSSGALGRALARRLTAEAL